MFCSNCRAEVQAVNGYCSRCGISASARLCPNGHVMDPTWSECRYCPGAGAGAAPGSKGRTLVESPTQGPPGGFVKGATLLEGTPSGVPGGQSRPVGSFKARTMVDAGTGRAGKPRTVFDPGTAREPGVAHAAAQPRLTGWLVSFSTDPSGSDFRLREGRNVIGVDAGECEVALTGVTSVSSRHAVIMVRDGKFQLRDNDSTNGTYVNGQDIFGQGAVELSDRDSIRVGEVELVLVVL